MTKEELRDYCYSIGLIDTKLPMTDGGLYVKGYRYSGEFVNQLDFIAAYDDRCNSVLVAEDSVISFDFPDGPIRMTGSEIIYDDTNIKNRINFLIHKVTENIKTMKEKQMQFKLSKIEGDFE